MAGSMIKRGENTWRLTASAGSGPKGRIRPSKTVTARSEREAEKLLALFVSEVERGLHAPAGKTTLAAFVEHWLENYAETNLQPKTVARYKEMLTSRIVPALGHLRLDKLKPMHLLEFYKHLQADGIRGDGKAGRLSERTVLHHHRLIAAILQDAVDWDVLTANPARKVKPPTPERRQTACYDVEQTAAMLAALDGEPLKYRAIVTLALASGLRRGEVFGLEWSHLNFERGTIEVCQASQYIAGQGVVMKRPKTHASNRTLAVPASVMALLRQHRAAQTSERLLVGDLWQGSNHLFTTWDGRPMHPDSISNWFQKFLARHELPHIPFHALRHTSATLLISKGIPLKSVSSRLGHSTIGITADTYAHALRTVDEEAARTLDAVLTESASKEKRTTKKQA